LDVTGFEIFMAMKNHTEVFGVMTPCTPTSGYKVKKKWHNLLPLSASNRTSSPKMEGSYFIFMIYFITYDPYSATHVRYRLSGLR
jgi:hypothetical protein